MPTDFNSIFTVLFEDNHLLVVNKAAGVLVQGDVTEDKCLADYAKEYLKEKYQKQGNVFCGVVHRLDRPVSGLVILAKTSKALERMNELFRENKISKTYWALVLQRPKNEEDTLINWLKKDSKKHFSIAYNQEVKDSQRAELSFKILKNFETETLLEVKLVTGRFHQIRSQLSKIGSKIKGDLKYGATVPNPDASICLHARKIQFVHPIKNEPLEIVAPLPKKEFWKNGLEFASN
ncbi:MAG: RluA family pseudouridine synthase [Cytophagales bacterium]